MVEPVDTETSFKPDTVGSIMGTAFIAIPVHFDVGQAVEKIRSVPELADKPAYVYVVDELDRLRGVLFMRDLVFSSPRRPLSELANDNLITVQADMDREEAARILQKTRFMALPVVDKDGRIVGTVTAKDISKVIQEEATEDILKLSGIGGGHESFEVSFMTSVKHRLPWLTLNIFLDLAAVSVIAYFQETVRQVIALAVILPIISDMSGNVGIQTVSLAVRELATGDISVRDFWRIIGKELRVGFLNGLVLGVILAGVGYVMQRNIFLGVIAGLALWINTVIAGIVGAAVPLILKKKGLDPATGSGIFLTTITAFSGFFLTLTLATLFISHLK